ncbi:MAG: DUF421 domain-containing protein [Armatimonadetes bacterium]|nr:DUF421 domain-containing protein [Armatimonadota bacterium]
MGLGAEQLTIWQIGLRAVVVYLAAIALVRLGEKRFLGKYTALDVILGFMLGSILSRAITNSSPFFEALGAALVLVVMHWIFAVIAFHFDRFGTLVKGSTRELVRDGEIQWDAMRSSHISENDLMGALRASAQIDDASQVKVAYLERSGDISAIKRDKDERAPRVLEIKVEDGVQTVRVEMS